MKQKKHHSRQMKLPNSLFFRTATTLGITSLLLVTITLISLAWFVVIPISKQSAEDLAAILALSAQTWVELPPETRRDLEQELLESHQLKLTSQPVTLNRFSQPHLYINLLKNAVEHRLGHSINIGYIDSDEYQDWIWLEINTAGQNLYFGFPRERVGARPPVALSFISAAALLLAIMAALFIALRLSRPLAMLSTATTAVGKGEQQLTLPETGPDEIVNLAQQFNRMAKEVNELLENRTTLLAGISHDLRTPLTRIKLTLEIMPETADNDFKQSMIEDVDEIEHRLSEVLQLARGVEQREQAEAHDLDEIIRELISAHQHNAVEISYQPTAPVIKIVAKDTLKRVLQNILENAIRYGDKKPVSIQLQQDEAGTPLICILDNGPGIPEQERKAVFRPFYRLENSRSNITGGSGLGLAIVQQLCHAQGWTVSIRARDGGGTVVCLKL